MRRSLFLSFKSMPVRAHLFLLISITSLPFFFIILFVLNGKLDDERHEIDMNSQSLIMNISSQQEILTSGVQQLLKTISLLDDLKEKRAEHLNLFLNSLLAQNPQYGNILVADRNGDVFASARSFTHPLSIADRKFYKDALKTKKFSPGEYIIGKTAMKPLINFGYPVIDGKGEVSAIIALGIDLEYVEKLFLHSILPEGSTAGILDWQGIILLRLKESQKYTGKPSVPENFRQMKEGQDEGTFRSHGVDGIEKIIFYRKLYVENHKEPYLYIIVSVPESYIKTIARSTIVKYLCLFGSIYILMVSITFIVSKFFITDRIKNLINIIKAIDSSDNGTDSGKRRFHGELDILTDAFGKMITNLAMREAEKNHALEEIKYRNVLLSTQQEASVDGLLSVNADCASFSFNRRFREIWGIPLGELENDHKDKILKYIFSKIENKNCFQEKLHKLSIITDIKTRDEIVLKDGTTLECHSSPISGSDGRYYGRLWSFRDITDRKKSEKALKESEDKFSRAFRNAPVWFSLSDLENGTYLDVNDEALRVSGFSRDEIIGKRSVDVGWISTENREILLNDIKSKGRIEYREMNFTKKDGRIVTGLVSGEKMMLSGRECLLTATIDISRRKLAEAQVASEKERLLVTLRSIADGVISTDLCGRIILMNRVAEALTDWSHEEAEGKLFGEVLSTFRENDRKPVTNQIERIIEADNAMVPGVPVVLVSRNGVERLIEESGAPIKDSYGKAIGVILVFRDITARQKTEKALHNALKLESLSILAGGIAHDFNNLLGGLFGFLELAIEYAKEKDLDSAMSSINDAISVYERAKDLTRQLLTFSKGGAPIRKTESIVELVRDSVKFALAGSNVFAVFRIPEDVWLCSFDKNQVAQVIDNISINARQAMSAGGTFEVEISNIASEDIPSVLPKKKHIRISFRDNGTGIETEHLPHIFDPFFTTKKKGTGLGLATSYSIIKRHGGIIEVESAKGRGSVFHIWLPASNDIVHTSQPECVSDLNGSGNVLIMDDEESILSVASIMLSRLGYNITKAKNGDEAISLATHACMEGVKISAAILDLTIPGGLGGKDTARLLAELDPKIKLIAASGYSDDSILSDPKSNGFDASIIKPFRMQDLAMVMNGVLQKKEGA